MPTPPPTPVQLPALPKFRTADSLDETRGMIFGLRTAGYSEAAIADACGLSRRSVGNIVAAVRSTLVGDDGSDAADDDVVDVDRAGSVAAPATMPPPDSRPPPLAPAETTAAPDKERALSLPQSPVDQSPPRLSALSTMGKRPRGTTTGALAGDESLGATPRPSTASQLADPTNGGGIPDVANPVIDLRRRPPAAGLSAAEVLKGFADAMDAAKTKVDVVRVHYDVAAFLMNDVIIAAQHAPAAKKGSAAAAAAKQVAPNEGAGAVSYFRIAELELYVTHKELHDDPFTHADELQHESGLWYFHRKGGTFKNGSFKGLDVTYGSKKCPCGALIRSIVRLPRFADPELKGSTVAPVLSSPVKDHLVDGPCLAVDTLLKACGAASIAELVADKSARMRVDSPKLTLLRASMATPRAVVRGRVMLAPRVGLIPREGKAIAWSARLLRFVTPDVACHMKHRGGLVAGALAVYALRCHGGGTAVAAVELAAMVKKLLATKGDVDGWADCPCGDSEDPSAETAAEKKDVIASSKLNSAAGAALLVRAGLRRGGLAMTFETLVDTSDDLLGL